MKSKLLLSSLLLASAIPTVSLAAGATRLNIFLPLNPSNDVQLIANKTVSIWAQCKTQGDFNVLRIYGVTNSELTKTILNGIDQYTGVDDDYLDYVPTGDLPDATAEEAEILVQQAPVGGTVWGNNDPYYGYIIDTNMPITPPAPPALPAPVLNPSGLMISSGSAALGVAPEGCYVSMVVEPLTAFKTAAKPKPPKK